MEVRHDLPGHRFIPARAGNTERRCRRVDGSTVHPRPRGEHYSGSISFRKFPGSSPPARGTRVAPLRAQVCDRFIPARAGNTWEGRTLARPSAVHPRPRGEHYLGLVLELDPIGSSPPARGTLHVWVDRLAVHRFIPARAGNTKCGP